MALFPCPACRRDVSEEAVSCPGCGHPIKGRGTKHHVDTLSIEEDIETSGVLGFVGALLIGLFKLGFRLVVLGVFVCLIGGGVVYSTEGYPTEHLSKVFVSKIKECQSPKILRGFEWATKRGLWEWLPGGTPAQKLASHIVNKSDKKMFWVVDQQLREMIGPKVTRRLVACMARMPCEAFENKDAKSSGWLDRCEVQWTDGVVLLISTTLGRLFSLSNNKGDQPGSSSGGTQSVRSAVKRRRVAPTQIASGAQKPKHKTKENAFGHGLFNPSWLLTPPANKKPHPIQNRTVKQRVTKQTRTKEPTVRELMPSSSRKLLQTMGSQKNKCDVPKTPPRSKVERARKACAKGNPKGCAVMAFVFLAYTKKNEKKALGYARRACKKGVLFGCYLLGYLYRHGKSIQTDYARAKQLFKRACRGGVQRACANLARSFYDSHEYKKAFTLAEQSCSQHNVLLGCVLAALMLEEGSHGVIDENKAAAFQYKGCKLGNADVCASLGFRYYRKRKHKQALVYFKRACDGCSQWGCFGLGSVHHLGLGTAKNPFVAVQIHKTNCDRGHGYSCRFMGAAHTVGEGGAVKSCKIANRYFHKACLLGVNKVCTVRCTFLNSASARFRRWVFGLLQARR